jgi:hypothetical protein
MDEIMKIVKPRVCITALPLPPAAFNQTAVSGRKTVIIAGVDHFFKLTCALRTNTVSMQGKSSNQWRIHRRFALHVEPARAGEAALPSTRLLLYLRPDEKHETGDTYE